MRRLLLAQQCCRPNPTRRLPGDAGASQRCRRRPHWRRAAAGSECAAGERPAAQKRRRPKPSRTAGPAAHLQEKVVDKLLPVDGAAAVGIDAHEELCHLRGSGGGELVAGGDSCTAATRGCDRAFCLHTALSAETKCAECIKPRRGGAWLARPPAQAAAPTSACDSDCPRYGPSFSLNLSGSNSPLPSSSASCSKRGQRERVSAQAEERAAGQAPTAGGGTTQHG